MLILLILKVPASDNTKLTFKQQVSQLDPLGTAVILPSIVCLILALQWGGSTYPWSDGRIIALLVLFGVLFVAFIAIQIWKQDNATVPPRIMSQRSIIAAVWFAVTVGATMLVWVYYLPVYFQAIKGVSAVDSGIMSLPLVLSLVVASIITGGLVSRIGYYTPFMILSSIMMSVGAGLVTTFDIDTPSAKWIGYQFICGFGLGMGIQQPSIAAQTSLAKKDVPTGASLMFFAQSLSGSVFISVGQNLFASRLVSGLSGQPGFDPQMILSTGATDLRRLIKPEILSQVLETYNDAVMAALHVSLVAAAVSIIGALAMEWKSVKKGKDGPSSKGGLKEKSEV